MPRASPTPRRGSPGCRDGVPGHGLARRGCRRRLVGPAAAAAAVHRRGHLRHRHGGLLHLRQPGCGADDRAARRAGAGPQHAQPDPPHPWGRAPLPRAGLPDLRCLPPGRELPHRPRGAVARRWQRLCGGVFVLPHPGRRPGARCGGHLHRHHRAPARRRPAARGPRPARTARGRTHHRADAPRSTSCASSRPTPRRCARRSAPASRARSTTSSGSLLVALRMDVNWLDRRLGRAGRRCRASARAWAR